MATLTKTEPMTRETLTRLEQAHEAVQRELHRVEAILRPSESGPSPEPRRVLAALQEVASLRHKVLEAEIAVEDARVAFTAQQREKRAALVSKYDREVGEELVDLATETDRLAAKWATFDERNRQRDVEYLAASGPQEFGVSRYAAYTFPYLGEAWSDFKTRVLEPVPTTR